MLSPEQKPCVLNIKIGHAKSMLGCHFCFTNTPKQIGRTHHVFLSPSTFTQGRNSLALANTCCTLNYCYIVILERQKLSHQELSEWWHFEDRTIGMTSHTAATGHPCLCLIHNCRSLYLQVTEAQSTASLQCVHNSTYRKEHDSSVTAKSIRYCCTAWKVRVSQRS